MRTERYPLARVAKALLPAIACTCLLAMLLSAAGTRPPGDAAVIIPREGKLQPSGSANTRIYVTGINTLSQVQGGYFVLQGYVTVANVSNPPNWDPWPGVVVALRMNGRYIYQSPAPGDLVMATTNGTGNFTLSYQVTLNHTAGNWNITAGIAPIPDYNYTWNPLFTGTTTYDVVVTADVKIPQPLQYSPAAFFTNDVFQIRGRLLTEGGYPVPGVIVLASFNNIANYTSSVTNGTGHFTIDVNPAVGDYHESLVIHFAGTSWYNARSIPIAGFRFIDTVVHHFTGSIAASTSSTPTPVNTTITISGRFTYDGATFGGDGNVKNKQVSVFWNGGLVGTTMTDAVGQYLFDYPISSAEPAGRPCTPVLISVTLDAAVAGRTGNATFYIRPLITTSLVATTRPAWRDESILIQGTLGENEPPSYMRLIGGQQVLVRLMEGALVVASMTVTTNATGGFSALFTPQNRDALNFTALFSSQGQYDSSSITGTCQIYKNAVFVFTPGTPTFSYPGPPYPLLITGRAYARGFGLPDAPLPNRQYNVTFNGAPWSIESTDGTGAFSFTISTTFSTAPGPYLLVLELRGFSGTGYNVATNRTITILSLRALNASLGAYITNPVFPNEALHVDGTLLQGIGGLSLSAFLTYANATTLRYDSSMVTRSTGQFHFAIPGGMIASTLASVRVVVNEGQLLGYRNATTASQPVTFINPAAVPSAVSFESVTIDGRPAGSVPAVEPGSSITIRGILVSHLGTRVSFYRVDVVDVSGPIPIMQASGLTDANGIFTIVLNITGTPGSNISFYLRTDHLGTTYYPSATYHVQVLASTTMTWILWFIPVAIAATIAAAWVYVKVQKKQEVARIRSYMQQKLDLVRQLVSVGKHREGIAYCYHILVEVATRAYNLDEVRESETVREFIEMLVNQKNVPREISFRFMVAILEGLYSKQVMNRDNVATVVQLLGNLYVAITNDTRETFTL